jgi:5'-nucleotidase
MKNKLFFPLLVLFALSACHSTKELVILHTNDTHSQVEATAEDLGGYVRRADYIAKVRKENKRVVLVDAGDFSQGTPFFNFFKGEVEVKALNQMRYDAVTLGNHEFDNGVFALAQNLSNLTMPVLCSNYDVNGTALAPILKPYTIIKRKGIKIGIIALCINPKDLITAENSVGVIYQNPVEKANFYAKELKEKYKCDMVICLSHLGDDTEGINDRIVAENSSDIDLIVGGHTHKLISDLRIANTKNDRIPIVQTGRSGTYIGEVKVIFGK